MYMDTWSPSVGDEFALEIDELNIHDQYAVATKVDGRVVTGKSCFHTVVSWAPFRELLSLNLCKKKSMLTLSCIYYWFQY